eukprot:TRINITY_DN890_c0_g1_i1.p1 TRINITY_DN890_c0_g1~~TRINITY_DN890_c0_g1_i1.p1  ORF type:complete len:309 (-),score=80.01 TRINITY_DN890_c0_g1_i1:36-962(-)
MVRSSTTGEGVESEHEKKGDVLMARGHAKVSKISFFNSSDKYEEAAELFNTAAAQYKIAKVWRKVAEAYCRAADMSTKVKDSFSLAEDYKNAASAFVKIDMSEAVQYYEKAANLLLEQNRAPAAAKLFMKIADLYCSGEHRSEPDSAKAIEAFQKAADCFEAEELKASRIQALIQIANHSALLEDYKKAVESFELVAKISVESALLKWGCKEYYFKSMLCWLVMAAQNPKMLESAEIALLEYKENDPSFDGSRDCKFVVEGLCAMHEGNLERFQDAMVDYDSIYKLDQWKCTMLHRAKTWKHVEESLI